MDQKQRNDKAFAGFLASQSANSKTAPGLGFSAFFIQPLQRLVAYGLLLGRLIEHTEPTASEYPSLREALRAVEDAQNSVNGGKAEYSKLVRVQRELRGCDPAFISEGRRLVREGRALWHHVEADAALSLAEKGAQKNLDCHP